MSAEVIELVSAARVEEAWDSYVEMARRLASQPSLLCDREFNEEITRRHERWRKLFMAGEPSCDVIRMEPRR